MSEQLEVTVGSARSWPLQCRNEGGRTIPANFAASDALATEVSRGQDQGVLLSLATTWYTAPDPTTGLPTQTGYTQAQVLPTITSAQSATLEPNGDYALKVWRTPSGSADRYCIWEGTLLARPAAGAASQPVTPYCTYQDMLLNTPWVAGIQNIDTDQEGFYSQRLQARRWLDGLILDAYSRRRGGWAMFGDASQPAANWSGWGGMVGPMRSKYLTEQLAANRLVISPEVAWTCAYKAASIVGLSQVGGASKYLALGQMAADRASEELQRLDAELDINGDGNTDLTIPLGTVGVLYT